MSYISENRFPQFERPSVLWKVLIIVFLTLILLIPMGMISEIISERQLTRQEVVNGIAETWAEEQAILGPMLAVPYKETVEYKDNKGQLKRETVVEHAYLLPQQYQVDSGMKPEVRYRGIYQSIVYTSDIVANGSFNLKTLDELKIPKEQILWKEAYVVMGIPNPKGIIRRPDLKWNGKSLELLPGLNGVPFLKAGLYAPSPLNTDNTNIPFSLNLALKGSQSLAIAPIGKQNTIHLNSDWTSPSFTGGTLPSDLPPIEGRN